MDNDDRNIEAVTLISEMCRKRKINKTSLKGQIHIDNDDNYNLLKDYLDIQLGNNKLDINIFNTHRLAAQHIWDLYPPHDVNGEEPNMNNEGPLGENISILIVGYTETTLAFIAENITFRLRKIRIK